MPSFAYRAASAAGRTIGGVEDAGSAAGVERALRARGLYPLDVRPAPANTPLVLHVGRRRPAAIEGLRYLATLLEAGFPLERALGTVGDVVRHPGIRAAFADVRTRLRSGAALADALGAQGRVFPPLAIAMVGAGERGGRLGEAVGELATHLEREDRLRGELLSASIYPALLCVAGGAAIALLMFNVLPRFAELLTDADAPVPWSTALVLSAATTLRTFWGVAAAGAFALACGVVVAWRAPACRRLGERAMLTIPLLGALRRSLSAVRMGRTLAPLLKSGMPILPALEAVAHALGAGAASELVVHAREEVRAGQRLAVALGSGRILPPVFLQMVDLGERGGRLPEMLDRGAAAAAADVDRMLARLVRLVEPVLIVIFGAVVGFVALALLQAITGIRLPS